jgi:(4S)-4-hydroxy-5-phosphonooxypentane-2,3-dione isomerase
MKPPSFAIAVTFHIKPECVQQFRARILQQASDSLERESGCCQFDVLVDETDATIFCLYETYVDAEAFVAHKATDHFADYDRMVADWVVSKQVRRLTLLAGENPNLANNLNQENQ